VGLTPARGSGNLMVTCRSGNLLNSSSAEEEIVLEDLQE
jgi:hypothetical protein